MAQQLQPVTVSSGRTYVTPSTLLCVHIGLHNSKQLTHLNRRMMCQAEIRRMIGMKARSSVLVKVKLHLSPS